MQLLRHGHPDLIQRNVKYDNPVIEKFGRDWGKQPDLTDISDHQGNGQIENGNLSLQSFCTAMPFWHSAPFFSSFTNWNATGGTRLNYFV